VLGGPRAPLRRSDLVEDARQLIELVLLIEVADRIDGAVDSKGGICSAVQVISLGISAG
jgi:hypothetical protein